MLITPCAQPCDAPSHALRSHAPRVTHRAASVHVMKVNHALAHRHTHTRPETPVHMSPAQDMSPVMEAPMPLLAKCTHFIMKRGQKAKAARTMNNVVRILQGLSPQNSTPTHALDMLHQAIHNVKPAFELRKARFGGRTQFIPATLPVHKQENQALKALIQTARSKHKKASYANKHPDMYTFAYFLAHEILEAYKHQGAACHAKHGIHKQAEHNRNHVRRRWW